MEEKNRYRIEAVWRAGEVLRVVANSREPMRSAEIARACGATDNTAFRICETLEESGFLKRVGDHYELGMGLALFYARYKALREGLRDKIDRELDELKVAE